MLLTEIILNVLTVLLCDFYHIIWCEFEFPLFYFSAMSMLGLILIALGTGGIKPCVAAFGGDQFEDHQACGLLYTHTHAHTLNR